MRPRPSGSPRRTGFENSWRKGQRVDKQQQQSHRSGSGSRSCFSWSHIWKTLCEYQIDGLVQNCSNSSALAMELLQSCTKPSKCSLPFMIWQVWKSFQKFTWKSLLVKNMTFVPIIFYWKDWLVLVNFIWDHECIFPWNTTHNKS